MSGERPAMIENSIGMKLTLIPAGRFIMGSPLTEPQRDPKEVPHEVVITRSFYMGVYEVTQGEFEAIIGSKPSPRFKLGASHPMENIELVHATAFCDALSRKPAEQQAGLVYRLPTEAEWEYACRAGTTTAFYFGETLTPEQANFDARHSYRGSPAGDYLRQTTPVGSYPPNAFGLYDMHGNVAELCADWYDPNYYRESPKEDPLGPPLGAVSTDFGTFYQVVRGGSWLDDARGCRSAYRYRAMPRNNYPSIGFRVVADVPEE